MMKVVLCLLMKIKIIYWEVGFNGLMLREVRDEVVNKFNVGSCMEKWFEDMDGFSWSENSDGFKWSESKEGVVVEGVSGEERWVFVKI
jgi:hypothetical protein